MYFSFPLSKFPILRAGHQIHEPVLTQRRKGAKIHPGIFNHGWARIGPAAKRRKRCKPERRFSIGFPRERNNAGCKPALRTQNQTAQGR